LAGFDSNGAAECTKVCFLEATKKITRVYNPFKMLRGKCVGVD